MRYHGYLYHSGHLLGEDVKELDVRGDSPCVCPVGVHRQAIDQGNDDVLNVDILLQLCAGLEEGIQSLKVELVREHLQTREERKG